MLCLPEAGTREPRQPEAGEDRDVRDDDRRARRGGEGERPHDAREEADDRHGRGSGHDPLEAAADPHRGERREDDEGGDEHRAHDAHAHDDGDRRQKGDEHVVELRVGAGGLRKRLVEGDGEDLVVKADEKQQHDGGQRDGEHDVPPAHREDAAEHIAVDVGVHAGGERGDDDADRERARSDERDGGVPLDLARLADAQQQKRGDHDDGHRHGQRRDVHRHRDRQRAEPDVGEAVADHRIPLEHEGDPEQGGTEGDEDAHDERAADKGIGE